MKPAWLAIGLSLVFGSVTGAEETKTATLPAPRVDHHQHLASPAGVVFLNQPKLDPGTLPQPLRDLIDARARHWNDPAELQPLFTDDARVLDLDVGRYLVGPKAGAEYLGTRFARPFRIVPIAFGEHGERAHFSGYFSRGEGADTKHFGRVQWELDTSKAPWRIALEAPTFPAPPGDSLIDADALVAMLDEAKIERAVVLSVAYWFDGEGDDKAAAVRAENDWTAGQVRKYPKRLVAFCSLDPTTSHALAELERCADSNAFVGLKLHFNVAKVNLRDAATLAKVQRVFEAANAAKLAIVVHARTTPDYEAEDAQIILEQLVAKAPDVVVQIAHLWGGERFADAALATYADAFARKDPVTRNLYFDISDVQFADGSIETAVERMRTIGFARLLYGSDAPMEGHPRAREVWEAMKAKLPLTEAEFRALATNVAPYVPDAP